MIRIEEIHDARGLKKFIALPWELYKKDPFWVPPLRTSLLRTLQGKNNPLLAPDEPHAFFLAVKDGQVVGRILVGVNTKLNREKGKNEGYISLFESIEEQAVANSLFETATAWLRVLLESAFLPKRQFLI